MPTLTRPAVRRVLTPLVCASALVVGLTLPQVALAATPTGPDFNGDRLADMAVGAPGDGNAVLVRFGGGDTYEILRQPHGDATTAFGAALTFGDFDGDGFDDLAVGDHRQDGLTGTKPVDCGAVWVYRGSPEGLLLDDPSGAPHGRTLYQQGQDGVPGAREETDFFGSSLAAGDLTGDGVDDLVIGANGEAIGTKAWAGMLTIIPGRPGAGLDPASSRGLHQDTSGVAGAAEAGDEFGHGLAIGDVTGDAKADLVVGVIGENGRGMVQVFRGTATAAGPAASGSTTVTGGALGIAASPWSAMYSGAVGSDAYFGFSPVVADVTGDGIGDVLAGAPNAKVGGAAFAGAIAVLRGSSSGISAGRAQVTTQSTANVVGASENLDQWGNALAVGDLTGDGRPEVVVAAVTEAIGDVLAAGAYTVLRTTTIGVTGTGSFGVNQETANVPGTSEDYDSLGWTLALQDLNLDGRQDVVITSPMEQVGSTLTGAVDLLLSSATGRPAAGSSAFNGGQFLDAQGPLDFLGTALAAGGDPFSAAAQGTSGTGTGTPSAALGTRATELLSSKR